MSYDWLLSAVLDDGPHLDGFEIVRLSDVTQVREVSTGPLRYLSRGLQAVGQWPIPPDTAVALAGLALNTIRSILESVHVASPMVGIHREGIAPDEIYIGHVVRVGRKKVRLLDIGLNGQWRPRPRVWRLADITHLQSGGRYQRALADFGDARPLR
ncbi:hypothetical protein ABIB25_001942 [Nakamurella sp. UYEF19]|uniref:hypothetical protein n=1 Tax=Nakamurella sp. UYEF19 TaxID=1756392 RepID=UPI00339797C9